MRLLIVFAAEPFVRIVFKLFLTPSRSFNRWSFGTVFKVLDAEPFGRGVVLEFLTPSRAFDEFLRFVV